MKMKGTLLCILALVCALALPLSAAAEKAAPFPLVFSREDSFFLSDTEGKKPLLLGKGFDPEISPDGTSVAFTAPAGKDGSGRRIALYTISSRKTKLFKSIPGDNSYGPRWSPDGKKVIFNHWDGKRANWVLGLLTLNDGKFRVLAPELTGVYSPFWSADSGSVYCHDLDTFFRVSVQNGRVAGMRKLSEITGGAMMPSSAIRFAVSPDGNRWLFDGDVEDTSDWMKSGEGLISAIFVHTPGDGKTRRLTGTGICAMGPAWLPGGEDFLFCGYTEKELQKQGQGFALFRSSLSGGKEFPVLPEGRNPSAPLR